ncbi:MAG: hypothetical protein Ct9H90mP10_06480 [Actinomycetota bacterium]|nr:MAG: hypothetical protein Ct9H90mP10_06480 [Actinomycetota bacterium]
MSFNTFAIGAKQLVVQDALEINLSSGFKELSFTPKTIVASISSLGGTVRTTFFAPEEICLSNESLSLKKPVDSTPNQHLNHSKESLQDHCGILI